MIARLKLIVNGGMKLNQMNHPWSIKFQATLINPRSSKLSDEEILSVESDAIDDIEYQSLHGAFKFGFRMNGL